MTPEEYTAIKARHKAVEEALWNKDCDAHNEARANFDLVAWVDMRSLIDEIERLRAHSDAIRADYLNMAHESLGRTKTLTKLEAEVERLRTESVSFKTSWRTAADTIEKLSQELVRLREANRWMPTGERLPEQGQQVLCYAKNDNGQTGIDVDWRSCMNGNFGAAVSAGMEVTHWRPLPEPPKEVEG